MRLGKRKPAPGQLDMFAPPPPNRQEPVSCQCPKCGDKWRQRVTYVKDDGKAMLRCPNCSHTFGVVIEPAARQAPES